MEIPLLCELDQKAHKVSSQSSDVYDYLDKLLRVEWDVWRAQLGVYYMNLYQMKLA